MVVSVKKMKYEVIYRIKNKGLLLDKYDKQFYELPIYKNDMEVDYNE